ncbi:alpha/beta hydrolase [Rhodococcus qingshengii]|uniref:alpha/beta hydrolase n=1 Tax=Rhodococcus qingshengii TaxID=334542 RepID=UPI001BE829B6|nr:alpha/beta hydrolase [Rhodococcus qingshengii]MBT2269965.1 alpha/beta hydrolase [Rhodococcus qingshengii]
MTERPVTDHRTVEFGVDPRQRLDVFTASPENARRTAVLVVHGGAFVHGDRTLVHGRCRALARRGFTALAVGYRLLDTAKWPAPLDDLRSAVRWTGDNADELGVTTDRIVVQGHSAGAQLALLVAGTARADESPAVAAVVSYFGAAGVSMDPKPGYMPSQMILGPEATEEATEAASALTYIDTDFPPTCLVHGAGDRLVPVAAALKLFDALTEAGVRTDLHIVAGQDHEFDMTDRYVESAAEIVSAFLLVEVVEVEEAAREVLQSNPFAAIADPPER